MSKHTMNVSLTPQLEDVVQTFLAKGLYGNQSEVVRAGLRLLDQQEQERQARLDALRNEVGSGLRQVLDGSGSRVTAEEFKARAGSGWLSRRPENSRLRTCAELE